MRTADELARAEEDAWLARELRACEPLEPLVDVPPRHPLVAYRMWDRETVAAAALLGAGFGWLGDLIKRWVGDILDGLGVALRGWRLAVFFALLWAGMAFAVMFQIGAGRG